MGFDRGGLQLDSSTNPLPDSGHDSGSHDSGTDSSDPGLDSGPSLADAGNPDPDAIIDCEACYCSGFGHGDAGSTPTCISLSYDHQAACCPVVGPLYPPDMPA